MQRSPMAAALGRAGAPTTRGGRAGRGAPAAQWASDGAAEAVGVRPYGVER